MKHVQGDLGVMAVRSLLDWVGSQAKSGTLVVDAGGGKRTLYFQDGGLLSFYSSLDEEGLAQFLIDTGLVPERKCLIADAECKRQKKSFPHYLLTWKILDEGTLKESLGHFFTTSVSRLLGIAEGEFTFIPDLPFSEKNSPVRVAVDALLETALRYQDEQKERERESLFETVSAQLLGGEVKLPPMPRTLYQIKQTLDDKKGSVHDVLKIIMADQVLTSKILKAVNSSYYSLANPVTSVQHAIVLIGLDSLLGIVTAHSLFEAVHQDVSEVVDILHHSFMCAYGAKRIAVMVGEDEEECFVCGLLHDIGKTVLCYMLKDYSLSPEEKAKLIAQFHPKAGVILAAKWNLPESVVEAVEWHHEPAGAGKARRMVEIVHLADRLAYFPAVESEDFLRETEGACPSLKLQSLDLPEVLEELKAAQGFITKMIR